MTPRTTALADQVDAARTEAVALMELVEGEPAQWTPRTDIEEWIRLGLLDTFIAWIDGHAKTCMHSPDPRRPESVFCCAWKPLLVVCTPCMPLLRAVGDADKTCDRCGHVCAGIEADDGIYTGTVWFGALAYQFGTCTDCRPATAPPLLGDL